MGRTRAGGRWGQDGWEGLDECGSVSVSDRPTLRCQSFTQTPWCIHNVQANMTFTNPHSYEDFSEHTHAKMAATLTHVTHAPNM